MMRTKSYKLSKKENNVEQFKMTCANIQKVCTEKNYKKIAISTSNSSKLNNDTLLEKLKENLEDIEFFNLAPIHLYADALIEAKKCDALLLVEKYCSSKFAELEKVLALAKDHDIEIIGTVVLR